MADKDVRTIMELRAGSLADGDVVLEQMLGREGISSPFRFSLSFRPTGKDPLELSDLIGAAAQLTLRRPGGDERRIHGAFGRAALAGVTAGRPHYTAELVPRLALLDQTRDSRIFQKQAVPDIVRTVLDEHRVPFRLALSASYPKREFCVQYQESDLAFVSRLLEEEGIFYFFEHSDEEETVVLADASTAISDIAGEATVPFRDRREARDEQESEHVFEWEHTEELRPGKVTLRDHTFEQPDLDLTATVEAKEGTERELYHYPGGYSGPMVGKRLARIRMDALQVPRVGFRGQSTCLRFCAGHSFTLAEHSHSAFNRSSLLLEVEHRFRQEQRAGSGGHIESGYGNHFIAVPASAPYRPKLRSPRPRIRGAQTAIVVGASGEEIHTDGQERIKVHFHWDREGKRDDHASCFLPLAREWAGPGMGKGLTPRVGQEVVVRFLEGDPDRPLVVGAVYNGTNAVPLDLPGDRVQSTFRTDSSPGGGGSNELKLDDAKGHEEVFLHGQKNKRIEVKNDKHQIVKSNESLEVVGDRSRSVSKDQTLRVERNDATDVEKDQMVRVSKDRTTQVAVARSQSTDRLHSVTVRGGSSVLVGGAAATTVGAGAALTVGGVCGIAVGGVSETAAGGALARQVGGAFVEVIGRSRDETVEKNLKTVIRGDAQEQTDKELSVKVGKDADEQLGGKVEVAIKEPLGIIARSIEFEADTLTLVVGGKVAWEMKKSGDVGVGASALTVDASSELTLKGSNIKKQSSDSAAQKSVELKKLDDLAKARSSVKVVAKSADGDPLANVRFKAELPDGSTVEGVTDAEGHAAIPSSKQGDVKLSFPDLDAGSWKAE